MNWRTLMSFEMGRVTVGVRAVALILLGALLSCGRSEDQRIRDAYERKQAEDAKAGDQAAKALELATSSVDWVVIPGGPFKMGDNSLGGLPERRVDVPTFSISRTEVTNAQYARFVKATNAIYPFDWENGEPAADRLNHPVRVSQIDAAAYAEWLGCRLPTRAEWEKAARGTDGRNYPWGNDFDPTKCNCAQSGIGDTVPVNSYPDGASPFGVLNMTGNVSEWTQDRVQTEEGERGVLKGGGWAHDNPHFLLCAFEYLARPTVEKNPVNGFRIAKDGP